MHVVLYGFIVRMFCLFQAKTLCRYGCMYSLAVLVLVLLTYLLTYLCYLWLYGSI